MLSRLTKVISFTSAGTAVGAAVIVLAAATTPAAAKDWRKSMDRHYDAAEKTRFVPEAATPEWGFTLDEVVTDMEWRQRTAETLRGLPRPRSENNAAGRGQLADRPDPARLRFAF